MTFRSTIAAAAMLAAHPVAAQDHRFEADPIASVRENFVACDVLSQLQRVMENPLSLSETYALKYWWCSPPRTGIASVQPTVWTARGIGASLCSDRCVRASL